MGENRFSFRHVNLALVAGPSYRRILTSLLEAALAGEKEKSGGSSCPVAEFM